MLRTGHPEPAPIGAKPVVGFMYFHSPSKTEGAGTDLRFTIGIHLSSDISRKPSSRPAVTFPASGSHRPWPEPIYAAVCLAAHACEPLAQDRCVMAERRPGDLQTASSTPYLLVYYALGQTVSRCIENVETGCETTPTKRGEGTPRTQHLVNVASR